jgi:hypothetical protein
MKVKIQDATGRHNGCDNAHVFVYVHQGSVLGIVIVTGQVPRALPAA